MPTRARGHKRVAAILDAAATVIAEKGYAATTMSEIAASSSTAIGSLYRFFPSKEMLADALLSRYVGDIEAMLTAIRADAAALGPMGVAEALIDMMVHLRIDRAAAVVLVDLSGEGTAHRQSLRATMREATTAILRTLAPDLDARRAPVIAAVMVQMMKAAPPLIDQGRRDAKAKIAELRAALALYIDDRCRTDPMRE